MTKILNLPKFFSNNTSAVESNFRSDLAGLRGVAVLLVAIFHIWFGRVSGGVDVFLAISGYFFVGSICKNIIQKQPIRTLNPLPRINKLLRRLLPAMIVVLTFIYLFGSMEVMYPPSKREELGKQVVASMGYFQNWYLAKTSSDYLAADSTRSPMQHLWSMSVQGQFFLGLLLLISLFGLIMKGIDKLFNLTSTQIRNIIIIFLSSLTLASFIYAIFANRRDYAWAYYDTFARVWEPLLAGLFSLIVLQKPIPKIWRLLFAWVGIILIFVCGLLTNGAKTFPGPLALIPVGATVLIILSINKNPKTGKYLNAEGTIVNRFLETRPLIKLGEISYSLYLWHWPILIFYLSYRNRDHVGRAGLLILLLSICIAWLSTNFIENPIRRGSFHKKVAIADGTKNTVTNYLLNPLPQVVMSCLLIICMVLVGTKISNWKNHLDGLNINQEGIPSQKYPGVQELFNDWRVPENVPIIPDPQISDRDVPITTAQHCISGFEDATEFTCEYGDLKSNKLLVVAGGSHAEHWLPILIDLANAHHFKIKTYVKMGCPLSTEKNKKHVTMDYPECASWVDETMEQIIALKPDYVFTTTTRPNYLERGDDTPKGYLDIFNRFRDNHIKVIGMRDTPWPRDSHGTEIVTRDCISNPEKNIEDCSSNRKDMLKDKNPFDEFLPNYPNMTSIDMTDGICDKQLCYSVVGNILVYRDAHHLSSAIVRSMRPQLEPLLGKATGWW